MTRLQFRSDPALPELKAMNGCFHQPGALLTLLESGSVRLRFSFPQRSEQRLPEFVIAGETAQFGLCECGFEQCLMVAGIHAFKYQTIRVPLTSASS